MGLRANPDSGNGFSLSAARGLVQDLFTPRPAIYWTDFLSSYGLGVFCLGQVRGGGLNVPHRGFTGELSQVVWFVIAALAFYRCSLFIHELVHLREGELRWFRRVWNALCGVPFLIPSFVYYTHMDHHRRHHYGTHHDGEYMPLADQRPWRILFFLSWSLVIPALAVARFMFFTPIAWCVPSFRRWVHQRASSMVMDPSYIRPLPSRTARQIMFWQELACCFWCWSVALIPPLVLGRWAVAFVVQAYLLGVFIITLNAVRTLGAHRWASHDREMSFLEQLSDSVNYPHRAWITELWGPVGTRFHALHHFFPGLPYHNLPAAHRRLIAGLPPNSLYHQTEESGLLVACWKLWRQASRGPRVAAVSQSWRQTEAA